VGRTDTEKRHVDCLLQPDGEKFNGTISNASTCLFFL
jgi:hypothetical protein